MGTGIETKIRDLVCEAVGYKGETVWDASRPDGQPVRCLDVSKARELIGFEAGGAAPRGAAADGGGVSREFGS